MGLLATPQFAQAQDVPANTLSEIQVESTGETETATGPVYGYRATRSSTAAKTDTPLSETPQSVTVVTRDQILDQGADNLQDALNYAAGVRSDAYGLDSRTDSVNVRGASPTTYLDGLRDSFDYYTSTARPEPYMMERIEVLRGPSAMVYGQGSTAGVINLVSKRPQEEFQGEAGVQLGNHGRKQAQLDLTGPLTSDGQWLYRLIALKRDADTQVDYVRNDRNLFAPSLTWRPSAATSLTFQGLWQDDKSGSTAQFMPWSGMRTDNPNGRIPTSRFIGEPDYDRYNTKRRTFGWQFDHRFNDQWAFHQGFRHTNNEVDYRTHYADSFTMPGGWSEDPINQRIIGRYADATLTKISMDTVDQHLQGTLQSGAVQHKVLLGLDFSRYRSNVRSGLGYNQIDAYEPVYGNYTPPELGDPVRSTQRQTGIYLQDQMKLGERWIVMMGLRHDRATTGLEGSEDEKSSATTKRLGVMYAAANGWSPYVSYSESFVPVAGTDRNDTRFKPLRGEQFEAGVKHQSVDGNNLFTASVYTLKEENQLTNDPADPLNSLQAGVTKNRGLELEWRGSVSPSVDVMAHYTYIDIDEKLEQVPRHQAAAWGKWRFGVGELQGFALGAGVRWMSSFADGAAPTTPSVVLFDAMLSYDTRNWRYALNLNNLTDKTYIATCLGRGDCWYGARRSIVASATYRF